MLVAATPAADPPPWPDAERPTRGASWPDGDAGLEDRAGSEVASRVEPLSLPAVDVVADGSETDTPAALPDPLDEDLAVGDELDSRAEVEHIRWIMDNGTGADRQLRAYAASGGDVKAVVQCMINETKAGLD